MRIGIVSDTHLGSRDRTLPSALLTGLAGAELILHAGDLVVPAAVDQLAAIAPVHAVVGNCDGDESCGRFPESRVVSFVGLRIGLWHGHLGSGPIPERALRFWAEQAVDVIVFGHSHEPMVDWRGGRLLINPGSPTQPRRQPAPTFAWLHIENLDATSSNRGTAHPTAEIVALPR